LGIQSSHAFMSCRTKIVPSFAGSVVGASGVANAMPPADPHEPRVALIDQRVHVRRRRVAA